MKPPYKLLHSDIEIICPECGSKNIKENEKVDVKNGEGMNLKQYHCEKCNIDFIPAIDGQLQKESEIHKWSKKIRLEEGLNNGESWAKNFKSHVIIIKGK
jgi:transposase-like protein